MKLIEEKLHQLHAEAKERKLQSQHKSGVPQSDGRGEKRAPLKGFAKINVVTTGSPADLAVRCSNLVLEKG